MPLRAQRSSQPMPRAARYMPGAAAGLRIASRPETRRYGKLAPCAIATYVALRHLMPRAIATRPAVRCGSALGQPPARASRHSDVLDAAARPPRDAEACPAPQPAHASRCPRFAATLPTVQPAHISRRSHSPARQPARTARRSHPFVPYTATTRSGRGWPLPPAQPILPMLLRTVKHRARLPQLTDSPTPPPATQLPTCVHSHHALFRTHPPSHGSATGTFSDATLRNDATP